MLHILNSTVNTVNSFHTLSFVSDPQMLFHSVFQVKERLQALMSAVEISEPCNPSLHVEITTAIRRLVQSL